MTLTKFCRKAQIKPFQLIASGKQTHTRLRANGFGSLSITPGNIQIARTVLCEWMNDATHQCPLWSVWVFLVKLCQLFYSLCNQWRVSGLPFLPHVSRLHAIKTVSINIVHRRKLNFMEYFTCTQKFRMPVVCIGLNWPECEILVH